jgi:hypothetical protein
MFQYIKAIPDWHSNDYCRVMDANVLRLNVYLVVKIKDSLKKSG